MKAPTFKIQPRKYWIRAIKKHKLVTVWVVGCFVAAAFYLALGLTQDRLFWTILGGFWIVLGLFNLGTLNNYAAIEVTRKELAKLELELWAFEERKTR